MHGGLIEKRLWTARFSAGGIERIGNRSPAAPDRRPACDQQDRAQGVQTRVDCRQATHPARLCGRERSAADQFVEGTRIARLEESDDAPMVHQGQTVTVRNGFGVGCAGGRWGFSERELESILHKFVRRRLGPCQKPPAVA